jgi:hypothetical protein
MREWGVAQWAEWRSEREAILVTDEGYTPADARDFAAALEALERLRLRIERDYEKEKTTDDDQLQLFA